MDNLSDYFSRFREGIVGNHLEYETPYGTKKLLYADWIASGRLYRPIEEKLLHEIGPWVANTHTETSEAGSIMTQAYHYAHSLIKKHVNAGPQDVIITNGFGMTGVLVKFQRILGLKTCGILQHSECLNKSEKPVVFITHMEHHSNQTSWYETIADVVVIPPGNGLLVDPEMLRTELEKYKGRKKLIGSFSACSNVTGIETPYHELAKIMHEAGGVCFVDFAASAPYVNINMHPSDPLECLDAIFFSPHKFLGGPGASGVLIFNKQLYHQGTPDQPGGGTVNWTNPWGGYRYIDDIEIREDGGTPGFLQAMKTALCIGLKNEMGVENMRKREKELVEKAFKELRKIPGIHILADNVEDRLGILSFCLDHAHYNLVVKLLSDRFGIQARGGCACAGTYGHYLLDVTFEKSAQISKFISMGDLSSKPGWIRLSLHPTMTDDELDCCLEAIRQISLHHEEWGKDYSYDKHANEFRHKHDNDRKNKIIGSWF
ncbi:MAG TPA: aminotransferase class V-fold PLP-dependent enzyme [Bacteroidales bacterium]|nr:aminotransferase class V-fold PLP-dependent enzyme [Bacteroidales bacterium]HPT01848.1 aminotransferase class V-fold PLP-dependent enzyme [Bacteroidales bacterium]